MFKKNNKHNQSQAILDFVLVFGILITFIVGLVRIWVWFNVNYAKRNVDYQNTRLAAGTADDSHVSALTYTDQLVEINDNWVFEGEANGGVGTPPGVEDVEDSVDDPVETACASARESAASLREQAHSLNCRARNLTVDCDDDDDDDTCENAVADSRRTLRAQADSLQEEADTIEEAGCDSVLPYTEPTGCS